MEIVLINMKNHFIMKLMILKIIKFQNQNQHQQTKGILKIIYIIIILMMKII